MNDDIALDISDTLREIRKQLEIKNELTREVIYELREIRSKV